MRRWPEQAGEDPLLTGSVSEAAGTVLPHPSTQKLQEGWIVFGSLCEPGTQRRAWPTVVLRCLLRE